MQMKLGTFIKVQHSICIYLNETNTKVLNLAVLPRVQIACPNLPYLQEAFFGAIPNENSKEAYSLVSCSVCPGFQEEGFFWPDIAELRRKFKAHHELLGKLSKPVEY
jgi:hypothetical protein